MGLVFLIISILIYTEPPGGEIISAIVIYISVIFFGFSYGPIPYSIMGEVLNALGVWIAVINLWVNMAILVFLFPYMV